jgi:hypothetical protein
VSKVTQVQTLECLCTADDFGSPIWDPEIVDLETVDPEIVDPEIVDPEIGEPEIECH